ncbi:MAG: class I SAM-dependent methyltransferase [Pseudomonadota bacterium]
MSDKRLRRLAFGLSTLVGRPRGFFSPYRHAPGIRSPAGYPALEPIFAEAFARAPTDGANDPTASPMECPADVITALDACADALQGFDGPAPEPRWTQSWYPRLDGAAAYAILRLAPPKQVIEVGSGHSTRFVARALRDAGRPARLHCIDPAPRAPLAGLSQGALEVRHDARLLSSDDLPRFAALEPGDVAFFDSSHLLWPGSDVDLILNGILPALQPGVRVHIHDVLLPDPYPAAWEWRGYTEQLGLGGWLAGGGARILWASHYAATRAGAASHPSIAALPLPDGALETALWLIRT